MEETTHVLKLKDNADIFAGLKRLAEEENIDYGLIVSGCGKIKEFELVSNSPGGGVSKMRFQNAFELNAISGKFQRQKNAFNPHIRVSITSTGFTPIGGQIINGKSAGKLEIGVRKIDTKKIIEA